MYKLAAASCNSWVASCSLQLSGFGALQPALRQGLGCELNQIPSLAQCKVQIAGGQEEYLGELMVGHLKS